MLRTAAKTKINFFSTLKLLHSTLKKISNSFQQQSRMQTVADHTRALSQTNCDTHKSKVVAQTQTEENKATQTC